MKGQCDAAQEGPWKEEASGGCIRGDAQRGRRRRRRRSNQPLHEDDFQRAMRLQHEADLRASSKHAPAPVYADQLDEWLKETSVPYTPDDNFRQTGIFEY